MVGTRQNGQGQQTVMQNLLQTLSRGRSTPVNPPEQEQNQAQPQAQQEQVGVQQGEVNNQAAAGPVEDQQESSTAQKDIRQQLQAVELPGDCEDLSEDEQTFYRWIGLVARQCVSLNLSSFDPEKILTVLQMNGCAVSNGLQVVQDSEQVEGLPSLLSGRDVVSFAQQLRSSLEPLIKYCQLIVERKVSVGRFNICSDVDMATTLSTFSACINTPFVKPMQTDSTFGKFDVRQCDNTLMNMQRFNLGKYHEYTQLYQTASYLFDIGLQQLRTIHNPSISYSVGIGLALSAQCTFQQVQTLAIRLNEIKLLTSNDALVREFARQTLVNSDTPLGLSKEQQNILSLASEARVRRARDNVRDFQQYKRGRYSTNNSRGRGRPWTWHRGNSSTQPHGSFTPQGTQQSQGRGQNFQQNTQQHPK